MPSSTAKSTNISLEQRLYGYAFKTYRKKSLVYQLHRQPKNTTEKQPKTLTFFVHTKLFVLHYDLCFCFGVNMTLGCIFIKFFVKVRKTKIEFQFHKIW